MRNKKFGKVVAEIFANETKKKIQKMLKIAILALAVSYTIIHLLLRWHKAQRKNVTISRICDKIDTKNQMAKRPRPYQKKENANVSNLKKIEMTLLPTKESWFATFTKRTLTSETLAQDVRDMQTFLLSKNLDLVTTNKILEVVQSELKDGTVNRWSSVWSALKKKIVEKLESEIHILSEKAFLDLIRASTKTYIIAVVATNGVGKTTSVAKITAFLQAKNLKISVAACDTFRNGAIEQLRTHSQRLNFDLYERKYGSDPASVAYYAIQQCAKTKSDVLLLDTAGRVSSNTNLMISLQKLIRISQPDLVLFLGEAQCGNSLFDDLKNFHQAIVDRGERKDSSKGVDACMITKTDLVDGKVGSLFSLSYLTRKPILFLGTGQNYGDIEFPQVDRLLESLFS